MNGSTSVHSPGHCLSDQSRPFVVEHRLVSDERGDGSGRSSTRFRPDARLIITPALRTSGLLSALTDEQATLLLWLLTSLTPNGRLFAPVALLAKEMGAQEEAVRQKMAALTRAFWDGEPIARHLTDEGMVERYVVSRHVLGQQTLSTTVPIPAHSHAPGAGGTVPPVRQAVIAHSRERYSRPRSEVESEIMAQLGHDLRETAETPEGDLYRRLRSVGVARDEVARLLDKEDVVEVRRQLDWLRYRSARDPARYLVAAVKGRYAPPAEVRWDPDRNAESAALSKTGQRMPRDSSE